MFALGRVYYVRFTQVNITNAGGDQDLFYLAPADDKPIILWACYVYNVSIAADMGDAQEEGLAIDLLRGHSTVGSGGSAVTPSTVGRADPSVPDPSFTARTNDTVIASAGTAQNLGSLGMNNRQGFEYRPTPEEMFFVSQAQNSLVVRLMSTVTDDFLASGTAVVREFG